MHDDSLSRLHHRIDSVARDVHTLELTTVRREGPLIEELRSYQRKVDRISDSLMTKEDFRIAIERFQRSMKDEEYQTFSKRDRLFAGAVGFVAVVLQVASVVILIAAHG